jgi:hypothetical protein
MFTALRVRTTSITGAIGAAGLRVPLRLASSLSVRTGARAYSNSRVIELENELKAFGRPRELEAARREFDDTRIFSLTGPVNCGKTPVRRLRIALHCSHRFFRMLTL